MIFTITLDEKEAADIMLAMARMPVEQIGETYVSVKDQLASAGYVARQPMMPAPAPGPFQMAPPPVPFPPAVETKPAARPKRKKKK